MIKYIFVAGALAVVSPVFYKFYKSQVIISVSFSKKHEMSGKDKCKVYCVAAIFTANLLLFGLEWLFDLFVVHHSASMYTLEIVYGMFNSYFPRTLITKAIVPSVLVTVFISLLSDVMSGYCLKQKSNVFGYEFNGELDMNKLFKEYLLCFLFFCTCRL